MPSLSLNRGVSDAVARSNGLSSGLLSARVLPTNAPNIDTMNSTRVAAINGRKAITPQVARVEYLADKEKLQLPLGLKDMLTTSSPPSALLAYRLLNTLKHLAGEVGISDIDRYVNVRDEAPTDNLGPSFLDLSNALEQSGADSPFKLAIEFDTGYLNPEGVWTQDIDMDKSRISIVTVIWGTDPASRYVAALSMDAGTLNLPGLEAAMENADIIESLGDAISADLSLNYSILDAGFLANDDNRWFDNMVQTRQVLARYTPRLSSYSVSMIAGLNLESVNSSSRCAWMRAYGVAVGLLPTGGANHNPEYQFTEFLPSNDELSTVVTAHPSGEDAQMYLRGCLSLISAFGALHLASDHTYKDSDETLQRKGTSWIMACRTTLAEDEAIALSGPGLKKVAIRTASHPFGLSATLGLFYDGQALKFLAEPLQIRGCVVPPPVASIGLIVSQLNKIFALPIGQLFRDNYGSIYTTMLTLRDTIVLNAAAYSSLYRHYGYDSMRVLSTVEKESAEALLYPIAGYSTVFDINSDDQAVGAALSHSLRNAAASNGALVAMYSAAFERYRDSSVDIAVLIGGSVRTSSTNAQLTN